MVVACGKPTGSTLDVRATVAATAAAGSFQFEASLSMPGQGGVTDTSHSTGSFDQATGRGQFTTTDSAGLCEQIEDGVVAYLKGSCGEENPATAKPWTEVPVGSAGLDLGSFVRGISSELQQPDVEVREVGHASIRGVATTHYLARYTAKAALPSAPPHDVVVDVWIDNQNRFRRVIEALPVSASPAIQSKGGSISTSFDLYDFGVKVTVMDPPPEQVETRV
jgi:hypothetical protein